MSGKFLVEPCVFSKFLSQQFGIDEKDAYTCIMKFKTSKIKNNPSEWDSKPAKELAEKYGLTPADFPDDNRTGRTLLNGLIRISINDVRKKVPESRNELGQKAFTSKGVYDLAMEYGLSPSDFNVSGKIRKSDVNALISKLEEEDE